MYMLTWTKQEVDQFLKELILDLYYEFCYKQRNQAMWDAGFAVMQQIGA